MSRNQELYRRACELMPGGVNSPVRAFKAVGGDPLFIQRAWGARMVDADGRSYIDYIGSWGAAIAGHAHPQVVEAVQRAVSWGMSFGACCEPEVQLAEAIAERVPSIERVRMVNSGTEAVLSAIRLARAATGRSKILKFRGCYHGHADSMLVAAGSGVATLGLPDSPGVPRGTASDTIVAPYNDIGTVSDVFDRMSGAIAAVIVEPLCGNMGVVLPQVDFLQTLRRLCDADGALLIFDEVMTGFRVARGGAQELLNVRPDVTTMGKVIGGGLPVGAYGGSGPLMDQVAPRGPVYQAGTLSGNPVAMAAGLATLGLLDEAAYERLERVSGELAAGLRVAFDVAGVAARVQRVGSMLTVYFSDEEVVDFDGAARADHERYAALFRGMLRNGVFLPPSGYESWFVSLAHGEEEVADTFRAVAASVGG